MFMTKYTERRPIGRLRRKWKFDMKMDLRDVGYEDKSCVKLTHIILRTQDLIDQREIILVSKL
jgi:hypothetical protein